MAIDFRQYVEGEKLSLPSPSGTNRRMEIMERRVEILERMAWTREKKKS